jgi:hypothetical protein
MEVEMTLKRFFKIISQKKIKIKINTLRPSITMRKPAELNARMENICCTFGANPVIVAVVSEVELTTTVNVDTAKGNKRQNQNNQNNVSNEAIDIL